MKIIVTVATLVLFLSGCTTVDVVLKEGEGGVSVVSASAEAPSDVPINQLVSEVNAAMILACVFVPQERYEQLDSDEFKLALGSAKEAAEHIKEIIDIILSWVPKHTYKAARACRNDTLPPQS